MPRRRLEDLAVLLGREVEARFFNADDLEILFQSQEFSATVAESITDMIFSRRYSLCYVREGLERSEEMGPALDCAKRASLRKDPRGPEGVRLCPADRAGGGGTVGAAAQSGGRKPLESGSVPVGGHQNRYTYREETVYPLLERALVDFGDRPIKDMAQEAFPQRGKNSAWRCRSCI